METEPSDTTVSLEALSDADLYEALRRPTVQSPFTVAELRAELARRTP